MFSEVKMWKKIKPILTASYACFVPSSTAANPRLLRSTVVFLWCKGDNQNVSSRPGYSSFLLCFKLRPFVINLITDQLIVYIYTRGSADL